MIGRSPQKLTPGLDPYTAPDDASPAWVSPLEDIRRYERRCGTGLVWPALVRHPSDPGSIRKRETRGRPDRSTMDPRLGDAKRVASHLLQRAWIAPQPCGQDDDRRSRIARGKLGFRSATPRDFAAQR